MSVQRWKPNKATERYWSEGMRFDADGAYVTYADHVAALAEARASAVEELDGVLVISVEECDRRVAEAEQRVREEAYNEIPAIAVYGERLRSAGYDEGYAAALGKAREAVEEHRVPWPTATGDLVNEGIDLAVAAIDALGVSDG